MKSTLMRIKIKHKRAHYILKEITYVLGFLHSNSNDAWDGLHAQFLHCFSTLLLAATLLSSSFAFSCFSSLLFTLGTHCSFCTLQFRHFVVIAICIFLSRLLLRIFGFLWLFLCLRCICFNETLDIFVIFSRTQGQQATFTTKPKRHTCRHICKFLFLRFNQNATFVQQQGNQIQFLFAGFDFNQEDILWYRRETK